MADPVINSFVQQFLEDYELESEHDYTNFELFANYCVFSSFNRRAEEFDVTKVHTGQTKDTGLDGIGIFIDDILVNSEEDAEQVIGEKKSRTLNLKFIFVQAKLKHSFEFEVVKKTIDAVEDFFADYRDMQPIYSRSEQVKEKAALASYLLKKYITNIRDKKPECNIYYICISHKDADSTIKNKQSRLVKELEMKLRFLSGINFHLWGSDKIEKLYRQTKRQVEATIKVSKYFTLKIPGVEKAYITAISFAEFKNIILDEDQKIKDAIFYDNIRGFLGVGEDNSINESIKETLKSEQEMSLFPLLNNGITIITQDLNLIDDDKYQLINYQVVNGCQTSHVLDICKDFTNIDNIIIPLRIIETDDDNIRNKIIKATNSQTEVKKELLAALSDFNKKLEECYESQQSRHSKHLYYERRPGQFFNQNVIKTRIIKIQPQIKSFTAMFLDEPHKVKYFDQKLIDRIGSDIFHKDHYPIAYYTSSWAFYQLNFFYKKSSFNKNYAKKDTATVVKYYLLMIFKYVAIPGDCLSCKNKKDIEKYCNELLRILDHPEEAEKFFIEANNKLIDFCQKYSQQNFKSNLPDYEKICRQEAFTDFILIEMGITNKNLSKERQKEITDKQGSLPL